MLDVEVINELLGQRSLGPISKRAARIERRDVANQNAAREELNRFGGEGWVCFTDRVQVLRRGEALAEGVPLSAELCDGQRSLHLRQAGQAWTAWVIEAVPDPSGVCATRRYVPTRANDLKMSVRYEVFWTPDELRGGVLKPAVARFAGFDAEVSDQALGR